METKTQLELYKATGWIRKPVYWHEVPSAIDPRLLSELKVYTSAELGINACLSKTFREVPPDPFFLVTHNKGLYLISTEGANYARYVRYVGIAPAENMAELRETQP